MGNPVIRVEGLGKSYRIGRRPAGGAYRYKRLSDVLMGMVKAPFRSRAATGGGPGNDDLFWALRDVSFEVQRGEVIGIVGRNGAGKSTLLKLLSRITPPTTGSIELDGRVASLLEVGTGFHPELTGRENIFLNGAVLGMSREEIRRNFDAIVAFAEVERFLDTPVKRYSSGMYMRLAFAVAAHLEPEILIVDEVLAVGDAEFQKKCLGKMQDVARKEGRTVLFVSHNMQAVSQLCTSAILLKGGQVAMQGGVGAVVERYLAAGADRQAERTWDESTAPRDPDVWVKAIRCRGENGVSGEFNLSSPVELEVEFVVTGSARLTVSFHVYNQMGVNLFATANLVDPVWGKHEYSVGRYKMRSSIPAHLLAEGQHFVKLYISGGGNSSVVKIEIAEAISFAMHDDGIARGAFLGEWLGVVRPLLPWTGEKLD